MAGLGMLPGPAALRWPAMAGADGNPSDQEPESIRDVSPARLRLAVLLTIILLWLAASWYAIEVRHQLRVTVFQPFRMATIARGIALVLVSGRLVVLWRSGSWLGRLRATLIPFAFGGDWLLVVVTLAELTVSAVEAIRSRIAQRDNPTSFRVSPPCEGGVRGGGPGGILAWSAVPGRLDPAGGPGEGEGPPLRSKVLVMPCSPPLPPPFARGGNGSLARAEIRSGMKHTHLGTVPPVRLTPTFHHLTLAPPPKGGDSLSPSSKIGLRSTRQPGSACSPSASISWRTTTQSLETERC